MAEPKQERDGESPSVEDDNNQRDTNQRPDGQQSAEQEPSGAREYGYSLESVSGPHQSQTAGTYDEQEQEEFLVATQTTDHQCSRREPICGTASQLPYLPTATAHQASQRALSSDENRQQRRVQRNDEDQHLQNQQDAHEDQNLFPLPGWTASGRRVQQCTEQEPPGGAFCDLGTGDPQEQECLCDTCHRT